MLAEIYNWFSEGFDTPDLKDAKTSARRIELVTTSILSARYPKIDSHKVVAGGHGGPPH